MAPDLLLVDGTGSSGSIRDVNLCVLGALGGSFPYVVHFPSHASCGTPPKKVSIVPGGDCAMEFANRTIRLELRL